MLAPEIHPAFGDITARLDRTFDGVSGQQGRFSSARATIGRDVLGSAARTDPAPPLATMTAGGAGFQSSILRPSDFALPDFRAALQPRGRETPAGTSAVTQLAAQERLDPALPAAVAALVTELLAQLGPAAALDEAWLTELREAHELLRQGQIQSRDYDARKAGTLGRLKYLKPSALNNPVLLESSCAFCFRNFLTGRYFHVWMTAAAQLSERATQRRRVESLPLLPVEPPPSIPSPLWRRLLVLSKVARTAVAREALLRWRGFVATQAQQCVSGLCLAAAAAYTATAAAAAAAASLLLLVCCC
jgi:hypothetical protein